MALESKYAGRVVAVQRYNTPGAWDNYMIPEYTYSAVVVEQDGSIAVVSAGHEEIQVDATPECKAIYARYLEAEQVALEEKRREQERRTPRLGRKMQVLKGKHKGFVGTVKWTGCSSYGPTALLVNEAGAKVWTKPTNVVMLEEAPPAKELSVNDKVRVKMGENAGKVGAVMVARGSVCARS